MSKKKRRSRGTGQAQPGSGEKAGVDFRPADLPEEEAPGGAAEGGAMPLGLPISAEEYEKLQQQARHRKLPPAGGAQPDPAGSSGDG